MTRRPRRAAPVVALLVAALAALTLTGCAAGLDAPTNQPFDPTVGAQATLGSIHVADLLVVSGVDGGETYAGIVNSGDAPDALTAVAVETAPPISLSAPVPLPPNVNVALGPTGDNRVFVHDLGAKPGDLVTVTLTFRDAGIAKLQTVVTTPEDVTAGS